MLQDLILRTRLLVLLRYWFYYSTWLNRSFPPDQTGQVEFICTSQVVSFIGQFGRSGSLWSGGVLPDILFSAIQFALFFIAVQKCMYILQKIR